MDYQIGTVGAGQCVFMGAASSVVIHFSSSGPR